MRGGRGIDDGGGCEKPGRDADITVSPGEPFLGGSFRFYVFVLMSVLGLRAADAQTIHVFLVRGSRMLMAGPA